MEIRGNLENFPRAKPEGNFQIHEDFQIHDGRGNLSANSRNQSEYLIKFFEGLSSPETSTGPSREGSVEVSGEGVGTGKLSKKFIRNSGLFREFAEIPSPVVNLKILVNFQITLGLRPREIWKFPRIFKFPPGIGNLSANSLKKPEFLLQIT